MPYFFEKYLGLFLILGCFIADSNADMLEPQQVTPLPPDYELLEDGSVRLSICFNWSCSSYRRITFSTEDMAEVLSHVNDCSGNTLRDRLQRLRVGVWRMELLAERYIPVLSNDLEVNERDADLNGRTDCVDNTSNTTTFLSVLLDFSALPGWSLGEPQVRDRFTKEVHWTATLVDTKSSQRWSVDSWFRPHGHLPFVMPMEDWKAARRGWEPPLDDLNPYPAYISQLCPGPLG